MRIDELQSPVGARHARKRVGRGHGSGHVKTAGRGTKGQKSRAGAKMNPGFEGGQLPLVHRLPYKRGFTNIFRVEYSVVNLSDLADFDVNTKVTPEVLVDAGLVRSLRTPIKVLGDGEIGLALHITAHKYSASARSKIEAAGGTAEEIAYVAGGS